MNLVHDQTAGPIAVVSVRADRVDAAGAIQFKDLFGAIAVQGSASHSETVLLDLGDVEFLDSSGLGAIVAARKMLGTDRTLALAGLSPAVAKVMRLTHMDRIFPIHDSVASCLAARGSAKAV